MKDIELKLVCELIRNSRKSDRELAKSIGVSQPTVSRIRARLEKEGIIEYTGVPNLKKLGFEILAITLGNWIHNEDPQTRVMKYKDFIKKRPNMIFVSTGRGLGSDSAYISVHKSYSDYAQYMQEVKTALAESMSLTGSFLIALNSDEVLRPISLRNIADCIEQETSWPKLKA